MRVEKPDVLDGDYFVSQRFYSEHEDGFGVDVIYYIQQYVWDCDDYEEENGKDYGYVTPLPMDDPSDITDDDVHEWFNMDCFCSHDCCGHMFMAYHRILSADPNGVYALVAYRKNV